MDAVKILVLVSTVPVLMITQELVVNTNTTLVKLALVKMVLPVLTMVKVLLVSVLMVTRVKLAKKI